MMRQVTYTMNSRLWVGILGGLLSFTGLAETIQVLSYNIRHGTGMDGSVAFDKQAAVIKNSKAQIVGLQEIDEKCKRSGSVDQTAKFAEMTEMEGRFGSFMDFGGGRYGMAMLSNLRIVSSDVVRLPKGREPRVAIVLEVETVEKHRLLIANVHFDWTNEGTSPFDLFFFKHQGCRNIFERN